MPTLASSAEEARYAELQQFALDFARNGETAPLLEMVRHGLPVNLADHKGNSLLMLAAYHGHVDAVRALLKAGADPDRRNDRRQTPLGGAAFKGYADTVMLLIEHGADIDADNGAGMTPIMFAAVFGRTEVIARLREYGASLEQRNRLGFSARAMVTLSQWIRRILGKRDRRAANYLG
jgi:hypothetical protein